MWPQLAGLELIRSDLLLFSVVWAFLLRRKAHSKLPHAAILSIHIHHSRDGLGQDSLYDPEFRQKSSLGVLERKPLSPVFASSSLSIRCRKRGRFSGTQQASETA